MDQFFDSWTEKVKYIREKLEREFEDAGVIAYSATDTTIVFYMATGKALKVEGFFYPEGAFMEINDEYLPTLAE